MPDGLYEIDTPAWAEQQADLLRRLAAGERVNDAIDWANVIEEVEDVGRSQVRACRSLLRQAMVHLLKLYAWPASTSVERWAGEIRTFLADARDAYAPSMRQNLSVERIYAESLRFAREASDRSGAPRPVPDICPFTLEALFAIDVAALLEATEHQEGQS